MSEKNITVINIQKKQPCSGSDGCNTVKVSHSTVDNHKDLQRGMKSVVVSDDELEQIKKCKDHVLNTLSHGRALLPPQAEPKNDEESSGEGKLNNGDQKQHPSDCAGNHCSNNVDDKVPRCDNHHLFRDISDVNMNDRVHGIDNNSVGDKSKDVVSKQNYCVDQNNQDVGSSEPDKDIYNGQMTLVTNSRTDWKRDRSSEDSVSLLTDNSNSAFPVIDVSSVNVVKRTKSHKSSLAENTSDDSSDEDIGIYAESFRYSNWVRVDEKDEMKLMGPSSMQSLKSATSSRGSYDDGTDMEVPLNSTASDEVFSDPPSQAVASLMSKPTVPSQQGFKHQYMSRRKCLIQRADSQQEYHRLSARIYDQDRQVTVDRISDSEDLGLHLLDSYPAYITSVDPGSAAEKAGITEGQILVSVNDQNVLNTDHADIVKLIHSLKGSVKLGVASSDFQPVRDLQAAVMSGHMFKLGNNTFKMWKRRYLVLRQDNCLYYYRNEQETDPLGAIPLAGYTISRHSDAGKDFCFKAEKFGGRTYYFVADNRDQMTAWVGALSEASILSKRRNDSFLSVSSQNVGLPALHILKPECAGFLGKLSPSGRSWKRRYCVLKDACLYYYKDKSSVSALGVAHLHGYTLDTGNYPRRKCSFTLQPPEKNMKVFAFSADNETDKKRWMESLIDSMQRWVQADRRVE